MRVPNATYRIQFKPGFTFAALEKYLDYLWELGISDIYASPVFRARSGSEHGYDVVDPNDVNPELGGLEGLRRLLRQVGRKKMGWIQDLVPNHMAFDKENWILMDVLENGQASEFFGFFDVDWEHMYEGIRGRILAPFLGRFYGESLEAGEIRLAYDENGFQAWYYKQSYPLRLESYAKILSHGIGKLRACLGEDHPDFIKILGVLYALRTLPGHENPGERKEQVRFVKRLLWETCQKNRKIMDFLDENLLVFNGKADDPTSFGPLEELLAEQFFRLAFWKVATEEINYRRFFNINDLIALRVEEKKVFEHVHTLVAELLSQGLISGLRVDHVDGLYDPSLYLGRLRELAPQAYLVVEKVCGFGEEIPQAWPIQGTTGYDFLNLANGLFCERRNRARFDAVYRSFTAVNCPYEELLYEKKLLVTGKHMAGDIDNLAHLLKGASSRMRRGSDITLYGLRRALVEVMAHFPVYRTYRVPGELRSCEREYILQAVGRALESNPGLSYELKFIEDFLLGLGESSQGSEEQAWHFVMRFQQFTGPLMAKGLEDTIFYVYNRLISLNEVGGFPERFGVSLTEFHELMQSRASSWPFTMNATSTHDTKRGEDVRARINVLSEIPGEWEKHLKLWSRINRKKKPRIKGHPVPDRNDEYFMYQTLLGAYPFREDEMPQFLGRLKNYFVKAIREAKVHTAWLKPDERYEQAFLCFLERILEPSAKNEFLSSFRSFQRRIARYGIMNSLSQTLLKLTSPGVPDFYQGTELWDLNLVDPDNRKEVDFELRSRYLANMKKRFESDSDEFLRELWENREDGRIKMFLIHRVLLARRHWRSLFLRGSYIPLHADGCLSRNVVCFGRKWRNHWAISLTPRFPTQLVGDSECPTGKELWGETLIKLPRRAPKQWNEVISGLDIESPPGVLSVGDVLSRFPVGVVLGKS